jgi:5'-methylthioadenosine phosphorylase
LVADLAEIGVFGGSGFYSLLDDVREAKVDTPYGPPSDSVFLADRRGRRVAFLPAPRPAPHHPAARINYRANVWAMRSLGVKAVISPCAAGSLQLAVEPGHFVVSDQFVDRTTGREDTFFDGPIVSHVSSARPTTRPSAGSRSTSSASTASPPRRRHRRGDPGTALLDQGRVEVVQRRRLAGHQHDPVPRGLPVSRARDGRRQHRPDHRLRRGVLEGTEAVTAHDVLAVFEQNAERIRAVVLDMVGRFPADLDTLGARDMLAHTRGDGHAAGADDIRIFETGLPRPTG